MPDYKFEINENSEKRYFQGRINFIIRLYYFLQEGLNQVNSGRNIMYALIALAALTALRNNYFLIGVIGVVAVAFVTIVGWLWITRGKKSTDYFVWRYASPVTRYNAQLSEKTMQHLETQVEQNKVIIDLLEKLVNKVVIK